MGSWAFVCEVMGSLPGTALDPGVDHPAWRANDRVLVRRNPGLRVPEEDALRAQHGELIAIRVDGPEERDALIAQDPESFFYTPHWASARSVLVWLENVDGELLRELLVDAWRARAPKRVVREWEEGGD